jgi:hypothetical protein
VRAVVSHFIRYCLPCSHNARSAENVTHVVEGVRFCSFRHLRSASMFLPMLLKGCAGATAFRVRVFGGRLKARKFFCGLKEFHRGFGVLRKKSENRGTCFENANADADPGVFW